jgi:hypothetical protein
MAACKPGRLPLIAKRAFDIIAAALVLAVLSPLFMLVRLCRIFATAHPREATGCCRQAAIIGDGLKTFLLP